MSPDDDALIREESAFYLDPFLPLLRAWVHAEGGPDAFIRCIQCSPQFAGITTFAEALARGAKTLRGRAVAYCDFCKEGGEPLFVTYEDPGSDPWTGEDHPRRLRVSDHFIAFCGARIAPIGVANDPTHLNKNWVPNVQSAYLRELREGRKRVT